MIRITCSLIIMLLTVLGAYESQASSAVKDSVGSVESDTRPRKRRFLKHSKSLVVKSVPFPQAQIQDRLYFSPPSRALPLDVLAQVLSYPTEPSPTQEELKVLVIQKRYQVKHQSQEMSLDLYVDPANTDLGPMFVSYKISPIEADSSPTKTKWIKTNARELEDYFVWQVCNFTMGHQLEVIWYLLPEAGALSVSFWSNWKENQCAYDSYCQNIYPAMCQALTKCMQHKESIQLFELCSGDGELAKMMFELPHVGGRIMKYHGYELNQQALSQAQVCLHQEITAEKVLLHSSDVLKEKYEHISELVDMIIASGALTFSVMPSKAASLFVLENSLNKLKVGGFLLLSGLERHFVCANDLRKLRLEVLNTYLPGVGQCYLAKKRA